VEAATVARGYPVEDSLNKELGFGAGDKGVGRDTKHETEELLVSREVLDGFFGGTAVDEGAVGQEKGGGEFGVGMGDEPGAVAEQKMGEERLGLAAIDGGGGFGEGFAESHKSRD
jgi:hypothetical protein